jgi:uncharacterized protein (DUF885 family)
MIRLMIRGLLRTASLAAVLLVAGIGAPQVQAQQTDECKRLDAFFAEEWERGLRENPESASFEGDHRYNDRWSDNSLEAIAASEAADREALARLKRFDRSKLGAADQLNYDTFLWLLEKTVQRQQFREYLQPISHQGGVQTADGIVEGLAFNEVRDYRDWLARMRALPELVDQSIALMRVGVKAGNVPPRVLMQRVPAQIAAQIVDDPTASPFYRPFAKFAAGVPESERAALQAEARKVIAERVVPAYRKLQTYFNDAYLPKTRTGTAVADLPNGKAYYDFLAGNYTTTDLSADAIHAIGLKEVARIRGEMEKVKTEAGFQGTLPEFFTCAPIRVSSRKRRRRCSPTIARSPSASIRSW